MKTTKTNILKYIKYVKEKKNVQNVTLDTLLYKFDINRADLSSILNNYVEQNLISYKIIHNETDNFLRKEQKSYYLTPTGEDFINNDFVNFYRFAIPLFISIVALLKSFDKEVIWLLQQLMQLLK